MTTIVNPQVPFTRPIPGGLSPGRTITIEGAIPPRSDRFAINLQCGSADIAFHFNPRFGDQCIVRNSYISGHWGAEETSGGMPLVRGEQFEAEFKCSEGHFTVNLNGKHFCDFPHRIPYHKINHINVDGDVNIRHVTFADA
ncbi:galectin-9-like [Spodoptera litura]|uniref:Galectin n=1 Tax=Spodoptera litura TaxID=69820 RepID=A0A9J7EGY0_SPOLT|nr:galectin-9-like [Spodoptera litura]